jgi:hypothetical protein
MELGFSMKRSRRDFLCLAMAALWAGPAGAMADNDSVVLVTAEPDPDLSLVSVEVRKLFLGFTILHEGNALRPILNRSDELLDKIFLQHVIAMSAEAYERRVLSMSLRQGRPRPTEVYTRDELIRGLLEIPHSVSFAWQSDVRDLPGIRAVRTLWRP